MESNIKPDTSRSQILSKLVRTKTITQLEEKGCGCKTKVLSKPKYLIYLKKVLLENSKRLVKTKYRTELIDVLVEIWEIFTCLLSTYGVHLTSLILSSKRKPDNKITNIFLESIVVPKDSPKYDTFKSIGKIVEEDPTSVKFTVKKLVFDYLLKGEKEAQTSTLEDKSLCYESKRSLVDVTRLLLNSSAFTEVFSRLCQLYAVIDAIISIHRIELTEIIELTEQRRAELGSYEKQNFLLLSEVDVKDGAITNYLSNIYPQ